MRILSWSLPEFFVLPVRGFPGGRGWGAGGGEWGFRGPGSASQVPGSRVPRARFRQLRSGSHAPAATLRQPHSEGETPLGWYPRPVYSSADQSAPHRIRQPQLAHISRTTLNSKILASTNQSALTEFQPPISPAPNTPPHNSSTEIHDLALTGATLPGRRRRGPSRTPIVSAVCPHRR